MGRALGDSKSQHTACSQEALACSWPWSCTFFLRPAVTASDRQSSAVAGALTPGTSAMAPRRPSLQPVGGGGAPASHRGDTAGSCFPVPSEEGESERGGD